MIYQMGGDAVHGRYPERFIVWFCQCNHPSPTGDQLNRGPQYDTKEIVQVQLRGQRPADCQQVFSLENADID
jgi:hypothetical protein